MCELTHFITICDKEVQNVPLVFLYDGNIGCVQQVRIFIVEILLCASYCICMLLYLLSLIEYSLHPIVVVPGMCLM